MDTKQQVESIFTGAGWAPHFGIGGYARQTPGGWLVGGAPNPAERRVTHMKITDKDPDTPDTPDDPVEAAAWLVARYPAVTLTTEATLETPVVEQVDESFSRETEAEQPLHSEPVDEASTAIDEMTSESAEFGPVDGEILEETSGRPDVDAIDSPSTLEGEFAEFGDVDVEPESLGSELLDTDYMLDPALLPEPEGEAPATDEPEPPPLSGQDRFIGLDDLDRVQRLRIGDVAAAAAFRIGGIEFVVSEQDGEYARVQGYVAANLEEHTGRFVGADLAIWERFLELERAKAAISRIDTHRKAATAWLLDPARTREEIVSFDPEAGWPE